MALKIKWNDDRIPAAATAILLIGRERILRDEIEDLVRECLIEFRTDPDTYKINKTYWPKADDLSSLTERTHLALYHKLSTGVAKLVAKAVQSKRQFNSLTELDNWFITNLQKIP
jgi:hypothetical protein